MSYDVSFLQADGEAETDASTRKAIEETVYFTAEYDTEKHSADLVSDLEASLTVQFSIRG